MKNVIKITQTQLVEMLMNWNFGAQPASIQYITKPKLTSQGKKIFGDVTKIANVGVMIGYSYENAVNNQRAREQEERNFMAQELWRGAGHRLSKALAQHKIKGTFYLSYKSQQTFKSFHFDSNLNPISTNELKPYFPAPNYSNQGVDKPVYHREISITNIRKLKFKKTTYEILPD